jgi:hypothetical protein
VLVLEQRRQLDVDAGRLLPMAGRKDSGPFSGGGDFVVDDGEQLGKPVLDRSPDETLLKVSRSTPFEVPLVALFDG